MKFIFADKENSRTRFRALFIIQVIVLISSIKPILSSISLQQSNKNLGIRYRRFVPMLVAAVYKLQPSMKNDAVV